MAMLILLGCSRLQAIYTFLQERAFSPICCSCPELAGKIKIGLATWLVVLFDLLCRICRSSGNSAECDDPCQPYSQTIFGFPFNNENTLLCLLSIVDTNAGLMLETACHIGPWELY